MFILIFYSIVGLFVSFVGSEILSTSSKDYGLLGQLVVIPFISGIVVTLYELSWLNIILFTPLILTLTWVIVSSLPTVNGGA
jgi:hypothetical protein